MNSAVAFLVAVGVVGCMQNQVRSSDSDYAGHPERAEQFLEAWPANQQACFDALEAAHMDLDASGVIVQARTTQDLEFDIDMAIAAKQQLRHSLEGFITALESRDRPRMLLYSQEVYKILADKRESNRHLIEIILSAAKREIKACTDNACLDDMTTFNRDISPKIDRAYACPDLRK